MIAVDDLKVGMWVAVTRLDRESPDAGCDNPFFSFQRRPTTYGGQPLKILAVSLPFVSVCDGRQVFALDVRETEVTRVDRRYVRAMTLETPAVCRERQRKRRRMRKKTAKCDGTVICPRCRCARLVERAAVVEEGIHWHMYCRECGYSTRAVKP